MHLHKEGAEIFIPDGIPEGQAIERTTHMAIAAHHDDIEIMAYHGIAECFGRDDQWFMGVIVTNGSGSPRDDLYAHYTDLQMQNKRKHEQKKSAYVGEYGAVALLNFPSQEVKECKNRAVIDQIKELVKAARPNVLYTHNLADKHDTHVATALRAITAIRELPKEFRPGKVYGCEVWRNLDWVNDNEKVLLDVSAHPNIAAAVLGVHDSQICGGKRYDLATDGRRRANATFNECNGIDKGQGYTIGMDLTAVIEDETLDVISFIAGYLQRFQKDVLDRLTKMSP